MKRTFSLVALIATAIVISSLSLAQPAFAAPPSTPAFGPHLPEGLAAYDGQDTCSPTDKPGVVAFKNMIAATYGSRSWGISRSCSTAEQSEHKEGRALDYNFDVSNPTEFAQANELIDWILKTDQFGNQYANARRLGIMYMIYNREQWSAYRNPHMWEPYGGTNPHTDHIHFSFSWPGANKTTSYWTDGTAVSNIASVYGVLPDTRLTYSTIDARSGNRTKTVVSTATLGFTAKAMATLNFNTLLVTNANGALYRVDVITNNTSLAFNAPVFLGGGWTHDHLTYDGAGSHLYGIADGALRRYTVTATKPGIANIVNGTQIGTGFTLKTLTATGADWLLGTTNGGELLSYKIRGAGDWSRYELRSSTWQVFTHLLSPGGGVYYGRNSAGAMFRYLDSKQYDGNGDDIQGFSSDPVDTGGWTQYLLSAMPGTVAW